MPRPGLVLDTWSPLGHKQALERPETLARTWVPKDDRRRLAAYMLLAAYVQNVGREYLRTTSDEEKRDHREYGEAELLVQRVVSGVLGDDMAVAVDGAEADLPEAPVLPDEPADPGADAGGIARASYEAQLRVWEGRARQAIEEWEREWSAQPALVERQEWLRDWAVDELFDQRVWECENQTVGVGDGVYVLAWSSRAGRPVVRVYDPGFYFPVLDDEAQARGYPTTVHLAWETDEDGDDTADTVRRITWRLGTIAPLFDDAGLPRFDENDRLVLAPGDRIDSATGRIVRRYPWAPDEDSAVTCYMTDASWPLRDLAGKQVEGFPPDRASYALNEDGEILRDLDLRIDFLPVVHVPNTPATQEHYGRSLLARVLQLLDDLADTDTDLQAASALAGTPMIGASGTTVPTTVTVEPGAIIGLGQNGRMDALDLSASVEALRSVVDDLLGRLSVNAQVPDEVLGRVDKATVESGISRLIKHGPYRALIAVLRLVREPKYRILLRFVQRLAQAGGILEPGPNPEARLVFGSFLPADRKGVIDEVVAMVGAKVISRATGLRLLQAAGVEISDVADELARIAETDFEGANAMLDALGDEDVVRAYLGVAGESPNEAEPPPPAPVVELP